uniref:Ig-like domain-containing protein n=1 Tax=Astyanax mexicanus TaxID=7994 RepID=A0A3B1IS85_ASTMX
MCVCRWRGVSLFKAVKSRRVVPNVRRTVLLTFGFCVAGVGAQFSGVTYRPESICALKGSTVIMGCSYSYPVSYTVQTAFWTKFRSSTQGVEPPDLLDDPEYRDRVQYLGDKQHNCSLSLRDVKKSDQSNYYFRFITDKSGGQYQGGVYLSVTGLQVEGPERVMEGDKVTLTCKTTCSLTDRPSFTWYRNGTTLSSRTEQLYLQSVSREDADRYSCAVLDQNLRSPEVTLNSVSAFTYPLIVKLKEGSSVILACSSDGNPPVEYTWYKGSSLVAQDRTFKNKRHQFLKYSGTVTLKVACPHLSISVYVTFSGETLEGSSVTLTCRSDGNPPVQKYTWFKEGGNAPVGSGHSYSFTLDSESSGWYYCETQSEQESKRSFAVPVTLPVALQGDSKMFYIHTVYDIFPNFLTCVTDYKYISYYLSLRRLLSGPNVDRNVQDNTYTTLDPMTRSSNDVYNTIAVSRSIS